MHTLLVGTRKGLFTVQGQGERWHITAHHFAGEPVTQVLADRRDGRWLAALRLGHFGVKLHTSRDQGAHWTETAAPAFPPKPTSDAVGPDTDDPTPWSVDMVWCLAAGGTSQPGTVWAGCLPAGLFRSDDGGETWALNTALWNQPSRKGWVGGGYDLAGIHSILVDPRDAKHITLAVSSGGIWQSRDGGGSWSLTARGMLARYMPEGLQEDGNAQDPHCMVQCAAQPDVLWVQHHCGMYRSADGGQQWQPITAPAPSEFGFPVACDPHNPLRAWFVPAHSDGCRIPVNGQMLVNRTDDGGRTFQSFGQGLPNTHAYHLVYRHGLDVSPDGHTLAMASTTGGLWVSSDAGESWLCVSNDLPPVAVVRFA